MDTSVTEVYARKKGNLLFEKERAIITEKRGGDVERSRSVQTEYGTITYTLAHKQVKNLNLRLDSAGKVWLSVPFRCPVYRADEFIRQKSRWITQRLRCRECETGVLLLPALDRKACYTLLWQSVQQVYPLVQFFGVEMPELKIRKMRSQWGNCHWSRGYITLNTALHRCPEQLRDYVALHELVHFLHHDHGPGFYAVMDRVMPDWRARRQELKKYSAAISE